jgi:hypothetical protein
MDTILTDKRTTARIHEDRMIALQQSRDEFKRLSEQQTREIEELRKSKDTHEASSRRELELRLRLEAEISKAKNEADIHLRTKEHIEFQLQKVQQNEIDLKRECDKQDVKLKLLEEQIRQHKLDEERKFQALENALSHTVKNTFHELKHH